SACRSNTPTLLPPWNSTRNSTGLMDLVAACGRAAVWAACQTTSRGSFTRVVIITASYDTALPTWEEDVAIWNRSVEISQAMTVRPIRFPGGATSGLRRRSQG
ncbi:MAG: hypothetical protein ACR2PL_15540, partial [Dehalococcoidia bacterium]